MGTILCWMSFYSGDNDEMIILFLNTEQIDWIDSVMAHLDSTLTSVLRCAGPLMAIQVCTFTDGQQWKKQSDDQFT